MRGTWGHNADFAGHKRLPNAFCSIYLHASVLTPAELREQCVQETSTRTVRRRANLAPPAPPYHGLPTAAQQENQEDLRCRRMTIIVTDPLPCGRACRRAAKWGSAKETCHDISTHHTGRKLAGVPKCLCRRQNLRHARLQRQHVNVRAEGSLQSPNATLRGRRNRRGGVLRCSLHAV